MRIIGATVVSKDTTTYEDLYQKSDKAMYKAKMREKNGYYLDVPRELQQLIPVYY